MNKLTLLAILFCSAANAQTEIKPINRPVERNRLPADTVRLIDSVGLASIRSTGTLSIYNTHFTRLADTTACIMLVSDTVLHRGFSGIDANGHKDDNMGLYDPRVSWMYGYVIYKWYYGIAEYLDREKKPVKLFVWLSKTLQP